MTGDEEPLSISEVAGRTGVSAHTLRYYERAGIITVVPRTPDGRRRYGPRELGAVEFVARLRATGMPIAQVRAYADLVRAGDGNEPQRLALLVAHHDAVAASLAEQRGHLDAVAHKIELYREHEAARASTCDGPDPRASSARPFRPRPSSPRPDRTPR